MKITAGLLLALIILVIFIFNFFPQIGSQNGILKIATDRLSVKTLATDLLGTRFSAWQITIQAIKERPLLGWGPENFYVGFEKYYDPTLSNLQRLWWDRPHNIFLDVFVTSGIFALIFYVSFWILLLWKLQTYKKKQGDSKNAYITHSIQAMFIGYLVALFFNFDSFATYLIAFFFVGYSFHLLSEQEEKIIIYPPKTTLFQKKPFIAFALIILVLFVWFWNIKPFYINEKISYISLLSNSQKCEQALTLADGENWGNTGILRSYAPLKYADLIKKCAPNEKGAEYSKKALDLLKVAAVYQPDYTRTWLFMGSFANVLAASEKDPVKQEKLLQDARNYFKKAIELSPKRSEIAVEQLKGYLLQKDYTTMKKLGEECIKTDPKQEGCYWYLGVAQIFLGDQVNGKKNIQLSREKGLNTPAWLQLGVAYISQKNYAEAADAYRQLIQNYPENASYHATLALLYKYIGEYEKAGEQAIEVLRLQPDNKESLTFVKGLIGLSPNNPDLHSSLSYVYEQIGDKERAKQEYIVLKSIYSQLLNTHPEDSWYYLDLAMVYEKLGEYENAYQNAITAEKLNPEMSDSVVEFMDILPSSYRARYSAEKE